MFHLWLTEWYLYIRTLGLNLLHGIILKIASYHIRTLLLRCVCIVVSAMLHVIVYVGLPDLVVRTICICTAPAYGVPESVPSESIVSVQIRVCVWSTVCMQ